MWIKICANTTLGDARLAAEAGADAVGFVFARSRRQVTVAEVAAITPGLPAELERVGVFDTQTVSEMVEAVRRAGLTGVQLHGALDAAVVAGLRRELGPEVAVIQAVSWTVAGSVSGTGAGEAGRTEMAEEVGRELERVDAMSGVERVLVDSRVGRETGGTGVPFCWADAAEVLRAGRGRTGLIVAGGLRPETVAEAIATLAPWGVDVATGVEREVGRKDAGKVRAFVEEARRAGARPGS